MRACTTETLFDGRITLIQPEHGYRFSMDPLILAAQVEPRPGERILDMGTGTGIIPLILAFRNPDIRIQGIEIQEELADLARHNVRVNAMDHRIVIRCQDLRTLSREEIGGPVHRITANPPYTRLGAGRINPDPQKAIARHELAMTLEDLARSMGRLLDTGGFCHLIYPFARARELIAALADQGIQTLTFRRVHPVKHRKAKRILLFGSRSSGAGHPPRELPPLFVYDDQGRMTDEIITLFRS